MLHTMLTWVNITYLLSKNMRQSLSLLGLVGWLVVFRIYVALAIFQPYRDMEAGDN